MTGVNCDNYFNAENNRKFMSASQFKAFLKCEAAALAELNGEFVREKTAALLVGSYVDAHFEGTLDIFRAKNPEIFKRDGTLKSEYTQAEYIINRIEQDELFCKYMSGEKQVIKIGEIVGVPFKCKIDSYHAGRAIVDLKIMRDFKSIYVVGSGRLNFVEAWGYDIQGAVYQAVEGNDLPFFIAAATKEKETDIGVFAVGQEYLDTALELVKANAPRYDGIKRGIYDPTRCERCDYCKRTKKLTKIFDMDYLNNYEIGDAE